MDTLSGFVLVVVCMAVRITVTSSEEKCFTPQTGPLDRFINCSAEEVIDVDDVRVLHAGSRPDNLFPPSPCYRYPPCSADSTITTCHRQSLCDIPATFDPPVTLLDDFGVICQGPPSYFIVTYHCDEADVSKEKEDLGPVPQTTVKAGNDDQDSVSQTTTILAAVLSLAGLLVIGLIITIVIILRKKKKVPTDVEVTLDEPARQGSPYDQVTLPDRGVTPGAPSDDRSWIPEYGATGPHATTPPYGAPEYAEIQTPAQESPIPDGHPFQNGPNPHRKLPQTPSDPDYLVLHDNITYRPNELPAGSVEDTAGYSMAQALPTGSVEDTAGYSKAQALPTGSVEDTAGYSKAQALPTGNVEDTAGYSKVQARPQDDDDDLVIHDNAAYVGFADGSSNDV